MSSWRKNESSSQAEENMRRCDEILYCEQQIQWYQSRLEKLRQQHRDCILKASLSTKAATVWEKLSAGEKWKKQTVLAALRSPTLPSPLTERHWQNKVPWYLRYDKDLVLARLERSDFASFYRNNSPSSFKLPLSLHSNKQIMKKLVAVYPEVVESGKLSPEILDDPEIFLAYLESDDSNTENMRNGGCGCGCLYKFSQRIRNDPKLMLRVVEHSPDLFGHICMELRSDRQFALRAARKVPRTMTFNALQFLSQGLRNDKEVVLAFVRKQGGNLAYASYSLHRDREIVDAACQQDPSALSICLHTPTKQALTRNKAYMLDLLSRADKCAQSRHVIWQICDPVLKNDRDIVVAAVLNLCLPASKASEEYKVDRSFWEDLLRRGRQSVWFSLPSNLKSDIELASLVVESRPIYFGVAVDIIRHCPQLLEDRHVAGELARELTSSDEFGALFSSSPRLANDREFVLLACQQCSDSLDDIVSRTFIEDRGILQVALQYSPLQLQYVPDHVQVMYPDLVAEAVRNIDLTPIDIYDIVNEDLWTNREVALAWASKGGGYLDEFPSEFENDKELFLLIAAQGRSGDQWCASEELRNDKEFMLKAVEVNGKLFKCAGKELKEDFDLALVAFAGTEDLVDEFDETATGDWTSFAFLTNFAKQVRSRLRTHEAFAEHFVFGIADDSSGACKLSLLNQDQETSTAFKQLIAEYLDVPIGKELRLLRQASVNLARWGF